jgi:hypothetical protein
MGSFLLAPRPRGGERVADNRGQITNVDVFRVVEALDKALGPLPIFPTLMAR